MSRAEWLFAKERLQKFSEDERRNKESVAMLEEWLFEHRPQTKVVSLDEWRERRQFI